MPVTDNAFSFFQELIRSECAVHLQENRRYLVEGRLLPVARAAGLNTVEELATAMRGPMASRLRADVIDALTTHETSFFRDAALFHAIGRTVLPRIAAGKTDADKTIHIWSAACSSGQEPVTLAITALENQTRLAGCRVKILATDVSEGTLHQARQGTFSALEVGRGLQASHRAKYFMPAGDRFTTKPELRAMIDFRVVNLARPFPSMPRFDLVLIRNVLIYFDLATRRGILQNTRRVMSPNGWLALGASETVIDIDDRLAREVVDGASFYRVRQGRTASNTTRSTP